MSEAARETSCDWTVTGMDCGSCATKIKDAVTRLPGVSGVEVGIMSERLRLTLDEGQTGRDKIEKTVRALGYEIAPRAAEIHTRYLLSGKATCIDCHKGIAHELPNMEGIDPGWKVPPELQGEALPAESMLDQFDRLETYAKSISEAL